MIEEKKILIVHETVAQALIRIPLKALVMAAFMGIGVLLESAAMQWVGFVFFCAMMLGLALRTKGKSPQEAADELYSKFGVIAKANRTQDSHDETK